MPAVPLSELVVGQVYHRRTLLKSYGGQWQGGISTPAKYPVIFLFTGEEGHQYGYKDGYRGDDGIFWYFGEGQEGDMQMARGNRAVAEHQKTGKKLYLFEKIGDSRVQYLGEAACLGFQWEVAPDRKNNPRRAIVFQLEIDRSENRVPLRIEPPKITPRVDRLWEEPFHKLRALALGAPEAAAPTEERKLKLRKRNEAVKVYVLRRANGICEGCGQPAPFKTPAGRPYLEPHHICQLADEGPDHPGWMAALCPNCHRRVHHGEDGSQFNAELAVRIRAMH